MPPGLVYPFPPSIDIARRDHIVPEKTEVENWHPRCWNSQLGPPDSEFFFACADIPRLLASKVRRCIIKYRCVVRSIPPPHVTIVCPEEEENSITSRCPVFIMWVMWAGRSFKEFFRGDYPQIFFFPTTHENQPRSSRQFLNNSVQFIGFDNFRGGGRARVCTRPSPWNHDQPYLYGDTSGTLFLIKKIPIH